MIRLHDRIIHAIRIIRGPYQKISKVNLRFYSGSFLPSLSRHRGLVEGRTSGMVPIDTCKNGMDFGSSNGFQVRLQALEDGQLRVKFPVGSTLKRATLFGWQTLWEGEKVQLVSLTPLGNSFECVLPAQGWWRWTCQSSWIDLHSVIESQSEPGSSSILKSVLNFILHPVLRWGVAACAGHLLLFLSLLHFEQIKDRALSLLTLHKTEPVTQTTVAVMNDSSASEMGDVHPFQGRSIFPAMLQHVETQIKQTDLAKKIQGLGSLFSKLSGAREVSPKKMGGNSMGVASGSANLAGSFKSLQSGLLAQQSPGQNGPGGAGKSKGSGGLRDVHWKSQFASASQGKGLTEGQQQMFFETFSKLQGKFRSCYETALLQFDEMAVTATFEAEINPEGYVSKPTFTLSGRSTPESQNTLVECLKQTLNKVKVDPKLSGIKIKNQFIFKS